MVIEEFLDGSPEAVYARLAEKGRMIPEGVEYVESWVTEDLTHCYQVMRCQDAAQLDEWMSQFGADSNRVRVGADDPGPASGRADQTDEGGDRGA